MNINAKSVMPYYCGYRMELKNQKSLRLYIENTLICSDADKKEVKFELETIESIHNYADKLLTKRKFYGKR